MADLQSCCDISDAKPFYVKRNLYLKPLLKINISIQLPSLKLVGKSISNVTLIENIKNWISPDKFCTVKVTKNTLEFIRFEGDLINPSKVNAILSRLDGRLVTLPGFKDTVKVRANIAKSEFPTRHDWDSFFRDAKHMNEMKAGERPDTLHILDLPIKWFSTKLREDLPSESLIKKIFQQFGEVNTVDIPSIDPYRSKMKAHLSGLKLFNFNQNKTFEVYVQFKDYISFVNAMDYLRGMKLLRVESEKSYTTNFKVDFDRTKHLSDYSIRKRKIEREKLMAKDRELEEKKQCLEDEIKESIENEKERKDSKEVKLKVDKEKNENSHCEEQNKETVNNLQGNNILLAAQRKLQSIRLLSELFAIIKKDKEKYAQDISKSKNEVTMEDNANCKDNMKSTVVKIDVSCDMKLNSYEEGNRLNSEVVKVNHSLSDDRYKTTDYKTVNYDRERNGLYMNTKKWQRGKNKWIDYDRHTHRLYYKYFQSLTRNKCNNTFDKSNIDEDNKISRSRSSSKSKSFNKRTYDNPISKRTRSSPPGHSRSYRKRLYSREHSISRE